MLIFGEFEPKYAYKRYAYKKKRNFSKTTIQLDTKNC